MNAQQTTSIFDDETFVANNQQFDPDDTRIIGGEPTSDFPECVAVGDDHRFCCTGTLIAPQVVVTAGHCAASGCSTRIFIGDNVAGSGTIIRVQDAISHPDYVPSSVDRPFDDLTVLILTEPVRTVAPVPICSLQAIAGAKSVTVAGYGNTDFRGLTGYGIRRKVAVGLASESPRYGARYDTEFVAGAMNLDQDSCSGDSGGPAYVFVDGRFELAGATSRATREGGRTCGDGGVYTRIPAYRDWLEASAGPLG
jgi:secreted trypsin-like serine protease